MCPTLCDPWTAVYKQLNNKTKIYEYHEHLKNSINQLKYFQKAFATSEQGNQELIQKVIGNLCDKHIHKYHD